jgi:hypothetical protein
MSNRTRISKRNRRAPQTAEQTFTVQLYAFDGRLHPDRHGAADLEAKLIDDACNGYDQQGEAFIWWASVAYVRLAKLTQRHPETVFGDIAAQVSQRLGRAWP